MKNFLQFGREKFDVILVAALFIVVFLFYYYNAAPDRNGDLKEFAQGLLFAMLALLGVRPRSTGPTTIQAETIETASTQTGDIVGSSNAPGETGRKKQNENELD